MLSWSVSAAMLIGIAPSATQEASAALPASERPAVERPEQIVIPAGIPISFEILDPISSKTSKSGDTFKLKLATPIVVDGLVAVPQDTVGFGEVVHASKAKSGGQPGELILAARYLDYAGQKIKLRSFGFSRTAQDKTLKAAAVAFMIIPAIFTVRGGEVELPSGTVAQAKIAEDVHLADTPALSPP